MKHIKSLFLLLLTVCFTVGAYSQTNRIYIPDVKMSRGSEATLSVFMDNADEVTAVEFTLEMPTDFTINPVSAVLTERANNHQIIARKLKNGKYKFVVMSQNNALIEGIAGCLFTIRVTASDNVTDDGDYPMTISDAVMSVKSGENVWQEADGGKITIKSMPNLRITSLDCSEPVAGKTVTVKWTVRNDGRGTTDDAEWKEYIWLVPNISVGTSMIGTKLLATVDNVSALAPEEAYESTVNVTLDERIYGNYDLLVTTNMYGATNIDYTTTGGEPPIPYDPENAGYGYLTAKGDASYITMEEENEYNGVSDNFFYKRINISVPPLPDIQVPIVVAEIDTTETYIGENAEPSPLLMAGIVSSMTFYSQKKVKITATITNAGGADIDSVDIKNVLYISSTPDLETNGRKKYLDAQTINISLKAGESITTNFLAKIPVDWNGDTYFIVKTDVTDAVYELGNKENNVGVSPLINTIVAPGADFVPYNLFVPTQISAGSNFNFVYSVRNDGAGVPSFYDDKPLINRSNLQSFTNFSSGHPGTKTWTDLVYISQKSTGIDASAICLAQIRRRDWYEPIYGRPGEHMFVGPNNARRSTETSGVVLETIIGYKHYGDSYTGNYSIKTDQLPTGIYYLYVIVDADDNVYEYDGEDNNMIISSPFMIVVPDLTSELLSVSEDALSTGTKTAISYRIKNIGTGDIVNANIKDGFFVSTSSNLTNAIQIGEVENTISIPVGGEKIIRANIIIPSNSDLNGELHLFVKTNINEYIKEQEKSNNASASVVKPFVYVPTDNDVTINQKVTGTNLTVYSVETTDTALTNEQIPVSYIIKNTGSTPIENNVKQEIFISKKSTFDKTAIACDTSGNLPNISGLQPEESLTSNVIITVPSNMMGGKNYLYVVINGDNALAEKKKDDNYSHTPIYINGNLPDLTVSDVVVPTTVMTSEKTQVSWTLVNNGSWNAGQVVCNVYLSTDTEYSDDDRLLANVRSGLLAMNASEIMEANIELEDDVVWPHFIIIRINPDGAIEELSHDNNIASKAFTARQSPLPDLSISDLSVDGLWRGGETITLNATVKNNGDHETRKDKWTDVFYLSEGYTLDVSTAIRLEGKAHVGKLEKDSLYNISVTANIPNNLKGYYVLYAITDAANAIIEKDANNNQVKTTIYIADKNDTPADLIVKKVMAPSKITAGENISISYTLANEGQFVAQGQLRDVLYLSEDNKWDKNDVMVGVVTGNVELNPGNEVVRKVTGRITNMLEGNYYLIVRTNSNHSIAETDYDNNMYVQSTVSRIDYTRITLDAPITVNTSGLYKLPLHSGLSGKTIGLYLASESNSSAGLYTAFESVPSTARYDRSASDLEKTEQEILIPDVQEGTYYILAQDNAAVSRSLNEFVIDGEQDPIETTMTLSAYEVQFGATTLSIKEGGTNGWISTEIHGALLDSIMDFRLAREGEIIPAEVITFYDQTSSKATFNLNDAKTGCYDFISELPDGTQATLPDGFKVVPGANVALGIKFDAPKANRIDGYAPVNVTYVNGGNTDIIIRELLLTIRGGELSTTIEGFKSNPQSELHIRPEGKKDIRGYVVIPPGKQETVNYYFRQNNPVNTTLNLYIVK